MNDHPILFSGPMVRAILEGRKTQTRRVMSYQPDEYTAVDGPEMYTPTVIDRNGEEQPGHEEVFGVYGYDWSLKCPYGKPGDKLWVRETWAIEDEYPIYRADLNDWSHISGLRWRPSIHMPRKASRLTLEIINIRAERLQAISEEDARAEGVVWQRDFGNGLETREARPVFFDVWDAINGSRDEGAYTVKNNPWVWVIEFKRVA